MKSKLIAAAVILLLAAGFLSGFFVHRAWFTPRISEARVDTLYIEHTVEIDRPVPAESRPAGKDISIAAASLSSISKDSISAPAVIVTYRDTLSSGLAYSATISGIEPKLENLQISSLQTVITKTNVVEKPFKGWLFSVTSNNAIHNCGSWALCSQNALEVSYNAGPFHAGLQGGILVQKPFCQNATSVSPYLGGRITIDLYKISR